MQVSENSFAYRRPCFKSSTVWLQYNTKNISHYYYHLYSWLFSFNKWTIYSSGDVWSAACCSRYNIRKTCIYSCKSSCSISRGINIRIPTNSQKERFPPHPYKGWVKVLISKKTLLFQYPLFHALLPKLEWSLHLHEFSVTQQTEKENVTLGNYFMHVLLNGILWKLFGNIYGP